MAYGQKYNIAFSSLTLKISQKNYVGSVSEVVAGSPAVLHKWDTDEPFAPIKGSSLTATIIGVPLLDFYSNNDDEFKGELYQGGLKLFSGYLVQDDCNEDVDDLLHPVTLSFTDNLGLLKDVTFDTALKEVVLKFYSATVFVGSFDPSNLTYPNAFIFSAFAPVIKVGDRIRFTGTTFNDYYTVTAVSQSGSSNAIAVTETLTTTNIQVGGINVYRSIADQSKITLFAVLEACIRATGIELPLNIYSDLKEDSQNTNSSFFEQTLVAKETFLKSERAYEDCYSVLEKLMTAFNCQILQAGGHWQVKRCYEKTPKAFFYDTNFTLLSTGVYSNTATYGKDLPLYAEYGYNKRILRPYQVVKETFNYNFAYQILKNADLKELGDLIRTYVLDAGTPNERTVKEYKFPHWSDNPLAPQVADYFIRVVTQGNDETERYVVIKNDGIVSEPIEGNEKDSIDFSFSLRTEKPVSLPANLVFIVQITNGVLTRYADNNGGWRPTFGYSQTFRSPLDQWNSVTLKIGRLPFDGQVRIFLVTHTANPNNETHFNDLRFQYNTYINESNKVVGHTHTNTQVISTKSKDEFGIFLDDSPRNFIPGTLFLNSLSGIIQNRTKGWTNGFTSTLPIKLGEITTDEIKQWRGEPRTIFEGNIYGDEVSDVIVSPFTTFTNTAFADLHLVPGRMEIDYANKRCSGTMHELYKTGGLLIIGQYQFDYIYNTK